MMAKSFPLRSMKKFPSPSKRDPNFPYIMKYIKYIIIISYYKLLKI